MGKLKFKLAERKETSPEIQVEPFIVPLTDNFFDNSSTSVQVPEVVIQTVEVIKEVPVEVIREVEVIKEVPIQVIKEIEKIVYLDRIIPKEVEVIKEVIVEIPKISTTIVINKKACIASAILGLMLGMALGSL